MKLINDIGSIKYLEEILLQFNNPRILLVTGKDSYSLCGAKSVIDKLLINYEFIRFSDFDVNPQIEDVKKGIKIANKNKIDFIIGVGGGSVLDMAKLIKACFNKPDEIEEIIKGSKNIINPRISLVAIPTTAGSGSESTHFAVAYINKEKFSVADKCLLPNFIILDGLLCRSASKYQKTCNGLDALAQGIESMWALNATNQSKKIAYKSVSQSFKYLPTFINNDNKKPQTAQSMLEAANLAGQAINISKTTAPHAWSYAISANYNLPHGHAVWITLPAIFQIHAECAENNPLLADLKAIIIQLKSIFGISSNTEISEFFSKFLGDMDIHYNLANDFDIGNLERKNLSNSVNHERLLNNPINFDRIQINKIFNLN